MKELEEKLNEVLLWWYDGKYDQVEFKTLLRKYLKADYKREGNKITFTL